MWDWIKENGLKTVWAVFTLILTALASWLGWDKLKPNPPPEPGPALLLESKSLTANVRDVITITAKTECSIVHWNYRGVEAKEVHQDAAQLKLQVETPGVLFVWAHGPYNNDSVGAVIEIIVVGPRPPPTPPTPPIPPTPPDPIPPKPPDPTPPKPPEPDTGLVLSLQNAYNLESDPDKSRKLNALIGVMEAASLMTSSPQANTTAQFAKAVRTSTNVAVGTTGLLKVRSAIGEFISPLVPEDDVPMTQPVRDNLKSIYTKITESLKKVK